MPPIVVVLAALALPWTGAACGPASWRVGAGLPPGPPREAAEARLAASGRLLVLLQDLSPEAVDRADPDVLVTDYSWDGTGGRALTRADVDRLRGGRRLVLAYLSLGEAEDYRFYWRDAARGGRARFVEDPNPDWPGSRRVRYWDPAWHAVLYGGPGSWLDRILAAGFDGVYLDTVDTAEVFAGRGMEDAAARMADLVVRVARAAREARPGFLVVAGNPFVVLDRPGVADALSGAVAEAMLFRGEDPLPDATAAPVLAALDAFRARGRSALVIEYVRSRDGRARLEALCTARRYLCYAGPRGLHHVGWMAPRNGGTP